MRTTILAPMPLIVAYALCWKVRERETPFIDATYLDRLDVTV
jgi:hypothetical protein